MSNEFVIKKGLLVQGGNNQVSGTLSILGNTTGTTFTGSPTGIAFYGTASQSNSSSYSQTSSVATKAVALQTARTFNVGLYATGSAQSFDGTSNISIPISSINALSFYEPAYVQGGITSLARPNFDVLRADRTAFLPASSIIIEKSTDSGVTWVDAGVSDTYKRQLFTGQRPSIAIPLSGSGVRTCSGSLRVTITGMNYDVPAGTAETDKYNYWNSGSVLSTERYFQAEEMWVWLGSVADLIYIKIETAQGGNSQTWTQLQEGWMSGWTGGSYISFSPTLLGGSTSQTGNTWNWRFTFRTSTTAHTFDDAGLSSTASGSAQAIYHIKMVGKNVWSYPNKMMYHDHLYYWDEFQNAIFPAAITASAFKGNLTGSVTQALTASYANNADTASYGINFTASNGAFIRGTGLTFRDYISSVSTTGSNPLNFSNVYYSNTPAAKIVLGTAANSTNYNDMVFAVGNNAPERMRIKSETGNVGIGTSTPQTKLHVQGDVSASNFIGNVASASYSNTASYVKAINYNILETKDNLIAFKVTGSSTLIGENAGANANVLDSIFVGNSAGYSATDANYATIIGRNAGAYVTTATNATMLGWSAGKYATNANSSVIIGQSAGQNATTASNAVLIGKNVGNNATNASEATILGANAGYNATNASYATMVGSYAGQYAYTASYATIIGRLAGRYATNALNATFLGGSTGTNATTGSNSIFIGYGADATNTASNVANSIVIGYNQKVSTPNTTIIGNSSTTTTKLYGVLDATGSLLGSASYATISETSSLSINSLTSSFVNGTLWATNSFQAYNVEYFGATGNGSSDDTTAIQNALNAAFSSSIVKTVFMPAGTYKITSTLRFPDQVKLVGSGKYATSIYQATPNQNGITWIGWTTNVEISDLKIYSVGSGSTSGVGIWMGYDTSSTNYSGWGGKFRNLHVSEFYIGANIRHWITGEWDQCDIKNNHIAVRIQKADSTTFKDCRIGYCAFPNTIGFLYETESLGFNIIGGEHGNCGTWFEGNSALGGMVTVLGGNYESFYGEQAIKLTNSNWRLYMCNPRFGITSGTTTGSFTVYRFNSGAAQNSVIIGGTYSGWSTPIFTMDTANDRLNYIGPNYSAYNSATNTRWLAGLYADTKLPLITFSSASNAAYIGLTGSNFGFHGNLYGTASYALNTLNGGSSGSSTISSSYPWTSSGDTTIHTIGDVIFGLGKNTITGYGNGLTYPYDYFYSPNVNTVYAKETSSNVGGCYGYSNLPLGKSYKLDYTLNLISGTAPNIRWVSSQTGRSDIQGLNIVATTGSNSLRFTPLVYPGFLELSVANGVSTEFTMSGLKIYDDGLVYTTQSKVGIGTSNPQADLHVNGTISASFVYSTASYAQSSSYTITASYLDGEFSIESASYAKTASIASISLNSQTSIFASQSIYSTSSISASYVLSSSYPWEISGSTTKHVTGNVEFGWGKDIIVSYGNGLTYTYDYFYSPNINTIYAKETSSNVGGVVGYTSGVSSGKTYRLDYTLNLISGTSPNIRWVSSPTGRSAVSGLNITAVTGSNTVTFSPTIDYGFLEVSVGTGATTEFTMSGINLYDSGLVFSTPGKLGVGVSNPLTELHVNGAISSSTIISTLIGTASFATSASYATNAITSSYVEMASGSGAWKLSVDPSTGNLIFKFE